jgi:integrase
MYLEVRPNGSRYWRWKYRHAGKEKLMALGTYPDVSLAQARSLRDEARLLLRSGADPMAQRKADKLGKLTASADTFGAIAEAYQTKRSTDLAANTLAKYQAILDNDLLPWLKHRPIGAITAPELLAVVRRIEARGANELAHRAMALAGRIIRHAIAEGKAQADLAAVLRGSLAKVDVTHHAAITDPAQVAALLRSIEGYTGHHVVRCALRLLPLLFVRPGELRHARWADIDLDAGEWRYVASKTKTDHLVPLAAQAVTILRELHPLTGAGPLVFPGNRSRERPISENTLNAALRMLGYDGDTMVSHGFRALARTLLHEQLKWAPEVIEHQLAHSVPDTLGTAYNRTKFIDDRRQMMTEWADYLDKLKAGADVVKLRA